MHSFKRKLINLFAVFALVFSASALAHLDGMKLELRLESITKLKSSETHGDELYFAITEYSSHGDSHHSRVPQYPMRWLSKDVSEIKDVTLWQGKVDNEEGIEILLSLIEMDVAPWNIDDLVGTVKVKFKVDNNSIYCDWFKHSHIPITSANFTRIEKEFYLNRDGATYNVIISLNEIAKLDSEEESSEDHSD